jgi:hypothetical protein
MIPPISLRLSPSKLCKFIVLAGPHSLNVNEPADGNSSGVYFDAWVMGGFGGVCDDDTGALSAQQHQREA